jgi:cell division protein FtsB
MTDEQFQAIMSELRALSMRIRFIEEDMQSLKDDQLWKIQACLEQLARKDLESIQVEVAQQWKRERL